MFKQLKNILWCFISVFLFFSLNAEKQATKKIWRINKQTVAFHKMKIAEQMLKNKYQRVGIMVVSSAVIAGLGLYAFGGFSRSAQASQQISVSGVDINNKLDSLESRLTRIEHNVHHATGVISDTAKRLEGIDNGHYTNALKQLSEKLNQEKASIAKRYSWWMWQWAKRIGATTRDNFAVLFLMGGLPGPINKMFGFWGRKLETLGLKIYHDSDLHWFISQETHIIHYFNDLERAAELLPLANDNQEQIHQKNVVCWNTSMLVKQLARMIAFMEYQAEQLRVLNVGCSLQMQASAKYIFRHVEQFTVELQSLLNDTARYAEIPTYIKKFRILLRSEQESFCINERAALYNIFDQIK